MFCQQCGAPQPDQANFCIKCGAKLEKMPVVTATPSPTQASQNATAQPPEAAPLTFTSEFLAETKAIPRWQLVFLGIIVVGGVIAGLSKIANVFGESKVTGAAQEIIQEALKSPGSFKLISATIVWTGKYKDRDAYIVKTEYDAQNGFGALLRGCHYVSLSLQGDQFFWNRAVALEECSKGGSGTSEADLIAVVANLNFDTPLAKEPRKEVAETPQKAASSPACVSYEPAIVSLSGHLERRTYPGPPNYESIKNGDEPEVGFYLTLPQPLCTLAGDSNAPDEYPQQGVTLVQLVLDKAGYDKLQSSLDRKVTLQGGLSASFNGHHHAPLLLSNIKL